MLYCDPIDQEGLVGGGAEHERNTQQNHLRIDRIDSLCRGRNKESINILDAGCGHGLLIKDLLAHGYKNVDGWDAYNPEYSRLPERDKYDLVSCVEMIEHTSFSYPEVDVMYRAMKSNAWLYIETSFTSVAEEENIPLEEFPYINVEAGHTSIFSHHALDVLMVGRGFKIGRHLNRHVRIFWKP
jgi:SAM-dependent methyltransferase